jgi:hypothetical protein
MFACAASRTARVLSRQRPVLRGAALSLRSSVRSAASQAKQEAWYVRHPLALAVGVATAKTAAADILIQTQVEKCEKLDVRRVALFTAFGSCYFGAFQYFLYVKCFSRWFDAARLSKMSLGEIFKAGGATRNNWLKQMGFDLLLHGHFFFPLYYAFKISITGEPSLLEGRPVSEIGSAAIEKYKHNMVDDWIAFWKIWIPGDIIVFGLVPMWARLPVNNSISFLYVLVLSFMRGAPDAAPKVAAVEILEDEK